MTSPRAEALEKLLCTVDALREPDGCPWDRKQTVPSMAAFVIEEGFELVEAIEKGDDVASCEELGDLLMVLAMICRIADEGGRFDIGAAAEAVHEKLVRRHPHVFGDAVAESAEEVLTNWEAIKREEREQAEVDSSALAGVPVALPALLRAARSCEKAVTAGFRWSNAAGAWAKLEEEVGELTEALEPVDLEASLRPKLEGELRERVEHELGDVLLAGAFLGSYLGIDPERACRQALRRFESRFRSMEGDLEAPLADHSLVELIAAWERAKAAQA